MIIREYRCLDCDSTFETSDADPVCPVCTSDEQERVFLTAPSIRSTDTSRKDTIVKELAADYGLTDVSNRYGEPVKKPRPEQGGAAPQFSAPNPQVTQVLQKMGGAADGFSGVLPALRRAGRPHQWAKVKAK